MVSEISKAKIEVEEEPSYGAYTAHIKQKDNKEQEKKQTELQNST